MKMKKLLLLTLVLLGGFSTVSADDTWTLKGSFDSWGSGQNFIAGNATIELNAGQSIEFKVVKNGSTWYGASGNTRFCFDWTVSSTTSFGTASGGSNNFMLFAHLTGTYTFNLTTSDGNITELSITAPSGTYDKTTIYFCNTLNWDTPYFYIRKNAYYNSKGSGSNQCPNGMLMSQIDETNIWKAEFPASFLNANIAFLDRQQDNYGNFYNANASVRGDFSTSASMFVPNTTSNDNKNGTTYYSNGAWHPFPTYTRTVTEGNFGTICLPFNATVDGATVFKIVSKTVDGGDNLTGVNLESVDALEAGKAYIFKATGTTLTATYTGGNPSAVSAAFGMMGNLSSTPVTVSAGNYVLKNNLICPVGANVTCGKYKGYITLVGIGETSAKGANFIGLDGYSEETDGIAELKTMGNVEDGNIYNLAGQKVGANYKGIIVVNGKKVVRK